MTDLVIREPAPAKVNPFLRVLGRRKDGYHDLQTLVQPITLADGVEVRAATRLSLTVAGPLRGGVPVGEENLALLAARVLSERAERTPGAAILVAKNVPVAAGLGGGSTDAAAVLRALNDLWALGWDVDRLSAVGAEIGSDVPALLRKGPVMVSGRGEVVEPVRVARTWWVLLTQPFGVSAADAYRWWDEDGAGTGPDPRSLLEAMVAGVPQEIGGLLFNDLEPGVGARHPEVREARERLAGAGALGVVLCGSGPTVAGLARDGHHAEEVAASAGGLVVGSISGPSSGR